MGGPAGDNLIGGAGADRFVYSNRHSNAVSWFDGDTVRSEGNVYRLVGFNTPEKGDLARCANERKLADAATSRLKAIIATGDARLSRVPCALPGQEGTKLCNYGRLC
ncbi:hypothetical protein [Bradyrhizobium huanghuaihaiense]|uniref:hypothetical protein n=1 Tax=Bradyrhizobium huanghuaihaiense TaxID=990078 RepID=UPI003CC6BF21